MKSSKIPKTGKIGNLVKNIKKETDSSVVLEVMQNIEQFESAFGKSVEVELVQSVITGGKTCKFIIHI